MYSTDAEVPDDIIGEDIMEILEYFCKFISTKTIDLSNLRKGLSMESLGSLVRGGNDAVMMIMETVKDGPGTMEDHPVEKWDDTDFKRKACVMVEYLGVLDQGITQLRHNAISRIRFNKGEEKLERRDVIEVKSDTFKVKLESSSFKADENLQEISIIAGIDKLMTIATNFRQYRASIAMQNVFDVNEDEKIFTALLRTSRND